jgi:hypothetical protein
MPPLATILMIIAQNNWILITLVLQFEIIAKNSVLND